MRIQSGGVARLTEGSGLGPYRRAIQDGESTEGVGPRTIQEGHTRRRGHRGGRAQDHTGGPYKTEKDQRGSGPGPYRKAIQDGEGEEDKEEKEDEEEQKEKSKNHSQRFGNKNETYY